jgi:hypothetical protein
MARCRTGNARESEQHRQVRGAQKEFNRSELAARSSENILKPSQHDAKSISRKLKEYETLRYSHYAHKNKLNVYALKIQLLVSSFED